MEIVYPAGKDVAVVDGVVVPVGARQLSAGEVATQIRTVVARMYEGSDPTKQGMTLLEAALFEAARKAADGDLDALNKLLDRILGKPVQQMLQATGTLKEFLDQVARSETVEIDPLGD